MKIKLKITKEQKVLLNNIFGTHRAIYNKLVDVSKDDCYKLNKKELAIKYREISQKHSLEKYLPNYHLDVPEEVMDSTYRDFIKSIDSSKALHKSLKENNKKTTFPTLTFKSRKDNSSSIEIRSRSIKECDNKQIRFFSTYFNFKKNEGFNALNNLPELNYSIRLLRTRNQQYYLCIPIYKEFKQTLNNKVCAIDPGVRDFLTLYDPDGNTLGITDKDNHVFRRCLEIDRLKSKLTTLSGKLNKWKRKRINQKIYNLYQRIKNMISDMHHKTSSWLSTTYTEILLPKFETSEMTSKQKRLSSKTSRKMLLWSHYKFKELLRYKMSRSGGRLIDCIEPYTSKTCTKCGRINRNLRHEKEFNCSKCSNILDRDINAARNIYLMNEHLLSWTLRVQNGDAYSIVS